METLFKISKLQNCFHETVFVYVLSKPITSVFQNYIKSFGELKYPLQGTGFIRLENKDILLTGNIGSKELKLTLKYKSLHPDQAKIEFENILFKYLNDSIVGSLK